MNLTCGEHITEITPTAAEKAQTTTGGYNPPTPLLKPFLEIWKFVLLEFGKKMIFAYDAVGSRTDRTGKRLKGCCLRHKHWRINAGKEFRREREFILKCQCG